MRSWLGLISRLLARTRKSASLLALMQNTPTGSTSSEKLSRLVPRTDAVGACQRQTVFYTPTTITISEGQKIWGRLTCGPNTKNNRDLDITISYQTDDTAETVVEYKMCVVFPFHCAAIRRLVNIADRWLGVDCIFVFILCSVALRCIWLVEILMLLFAFAVCEPFLGGLVVGVLYRY